jgi:hypothetical protein
MTFNQKLSHHHGNLDSAHDALLDSLEQELSETEILEDEILSDSDLFNRLAIMFARWDTGNGYPQKTFLDWSVEQLRRERTPQWKRWED